MPASIHCLQSSTAKGSERSTRWLCGSACCTLPVSVQTRDPAGGRAARRFLSVLATANTSSLSPFSLRPPPPTLPSISEGVTGRPGACAQDEPSPTPISPEDGRRGHGQIG